MNFFTSIDRIVIMAMFLTHALSASAQAVLETSKENPVAAQRARVSAALDKLGPFQLAGCWLSPQIRPLIGVSTKDKTGVRVWAVAPEANTLSRVRTGDLLESVDGTVIAPDASEDMRAVSRARSAAFKRLGEGGRGFVENYKNAAGEVVSVVNPVSVHCSANDVFVQGEKFDRAATRSYGFLIAASRLALLDDEQLLAFLVWNHAFVSLRNESNADSWAGFTAFANGTPANYIYGSGVHEKIDWVTLTLLRAMSANMNAYASMITVVEAFDKAAGVQLFGDKRFVDAQSGGSPFGGEEKQTRLSAWVKLLQADADAPGPSSLKFSNALLARPTRPAQTMPLPAFQAVDEALHPFLGEAQAKAVAVRYMANFSRAQTPAEIQSSPPGGAPRVPEFQMVYAHHATKRLIWLTRKRPDQGDGEICVQPGDCSVIVLGPYAIARPSTAWAQELSATPGAYKLEENK